MLSYKYLEHKTDVFIEVNASTLENAFLVAGYATIETMLNRNNVQEKKQKTLIINGIDLDYLLYNWLEELIILTITDGFAIKRMILSINKNKTYEMKSNIFGETLNIKKHKFKLEIKSPTFHLMDINELNNRIRFILDL